MSKPITWLYKCHHCKIDSQSIFYFGHLKEHLEESHNIIVNTEEEAVQHFTKGFDVMSHINL